MDWFEVQRINNYEGKGLNSSAEWCQNEFMASQLSPLGQIGKWLFVPAILASTGFFLIGPRLQKSIPTLDKPADHTTDKNSSGTTPPFVEGDPTRVHSEKRASAPSTRDMTNAPSSQTEPDQGGPDVIIREKPANGGDPAVVYQTPRTTTRAEPRAKKRRKKVHVKTEVKVDSSDSGSVGGLDGSSPSAGNGSGSDASSGSNPGP